MNSKKTQQMCLSGLMAAVICVFTAFFKINTGVNTGYMHLGDAMIYLAGMLLGPWAMPAAAIGGAMADMLAGAPQWAPATAVIKVVCTLPMLSALSIQKKSGRPRRIVTLSSVLMSIISGAITVGGYLVAEGLMYSFPAAVASIPFNAIQALAATVAFATIGAALDAARVTKHLNI